MNAKSLLAVAWVATMAALVGLALTWGADGMMLVFILLALSVMTIGALTSEAKARKDGNS